MENLVAGRACGECQVCCITPQIDTPEIRKTSGVACRNLTGAGCAIHATRPAVCQGFYCGWRILEDLPNDWRPDRCGVLVLLDQGMDLPPQFRLRTAVILALVDNPLKTVRQRWFQDYVGRSVMAGVPLFLSVPPLKGNQMARAMLNTTAMRDAAVSRTAARIKDELEKTLKAVALYPPMKYVAVHGGPDMDG
jgi:hypothetical protein